jgi:hypothetical protein
MRSIAIGIVLSVLLSIGASGLQAADPSAYEVLGMKPGMTMDKIEAALRGQKLDSLKVVRAPSFKQSVALARKEPMASSTYDGVQTLRAENDSVSVQVFFVPMKDGPVAAKITTEIFSEANKLSESLVEKYGQPAEKTEREWLWGDTAAFYARTKAYLEFRPNPASATARKPVAIIVTGDPSLEKSSRAAIDAVAQDPS